MTEMITLRRDAFSTQNHYGETTTTKDREEKDEEPSSPSFDLFAMKSSIEKMTKEQQVKILHLIRSDPGVKINSNKSGVYINLSFLPRGIMNELWKNIQYIKEQEKQLNIDEMQKQIYHDSFFASDTEAVVSVSKSVSASASAAGDTHAISATAAAATATAFYNG